MSFEPIPVETEFAAKTLIDAAFSVYRELGPGLLESVYEACLCHELTLRGVAFQSQLALPVKYRGMQLDGGLRLDLVVENRLVIELKAVEMLLPVHEAQVLTYLKLSGHRLGILLNFNVPRIKDGIKRIVLELSPLCLRDFVVKFPPHTERKDDLSPFLFSFPSQT